MKHFYNSNMAAGNSQQIAKAMGTAISGKLFSFLLLGFFLLVSGESYGQAARTLFSKQSGDWDSANTWEMASGNGNSMVNVTSGPSSIDNVIIEKSHSITVGGTKEISNLELRFSTGNSQPTLIINGALTVATINLNVSNNATNSLATLTINGDLTINQTSTWASNGKFTIVCGDNSTVIYKGATSVLPVQTYNSSTSLPIDGSYNNLIIEGNGIKRASKNLLVRADMTIRETATFSPESFSLDVNGNLSVLNTGASLTGNSTIAGLGLTVGGNVVNNGTIALQTRKMTVSNNFINNAGSTFTAGSGTHTVNGNWSNAGTFNASTGTVVLAGANKTISSTGSGAFNNLTLSGGAKNLLSNITVNGLITLNNTILTTGTDKVTLGIAASITGETANQHIVGTVETVRPVTTGNTQTFGNMGFSITNSNADFGQVTVVRTTGTPRIERNEKSVNRQYTVSNTAGASVTGTNLAFAFSEYDLNEPKEQTYDLYRFNEDNISRLATSVPYNSIPVVTTSGIAGAYTLYSSSIVPLPVEFVSFNVKHDVKGAKLVWATASELDNKGFEVQVSTDSRTFVSIGFVESKVGTTSLRQEYSFIDTKAVSSTRYYRLKQIDLDGTASLSPVRAIVLDGDNSIAAAYPNPFSDVITVRLTGTESRQVKATLTDAMGKVMLETVEETAGNSISVNTHNIPTSGMYMLHIYDNDTRYTFKLMKR